MSKVKRAPARRKPTRRKSPKKQTAAASAPRRFRNWIEARLRGARYSAANAVRLVGVLAAAVFLLVIGGLFVFGALDDAGASVMRMAERQTASLGMAVHVIDVSGVEADESALVADAVSTFHGQSMLAFNPHQARADVEALPWVREATVIRLWPNRISIVVEPRSEFALWQVEGEIHVIDRDGSVLGEARASDWPDLPLVVGFGANTAAENLIETLEHHDEIARRVSAMVRVGDRRWNLRLANGLDVKLPETEMGAALALLTAMQAERGVLRLDAESIDLRQPGEMIVRALPERARAAGIGESEA
ncbi:cell division protein FtsQ/DivIB [Hyphobacterium sp.]|uniref:cell division protein FtsQ/DivIB n=1 Tax=Hyphobacterium sp. TaxID=2004662 RepID=UPI003BACD699